MSFLKKFAKKKLGLEKKQSLADEMMSRLDELSNMVDRAYKEAKNEGKTDAEKKLMEVGSEMDKIFKLIQEYRRMG